MMDRNDKFLSTIARKMTNKLQKCDGAVCDDIARIEQVIETRFECNLRFDLELPRRYVVLPSASQ